MSQFCPECGAGEVSRDAKSLTFLLPRDYPFDAPCATCRVRSEEAMRALGRRIAEKRERVVLDAIGDAPARVCCIAMMLFCVTLLGCAVRLLLDLLEKS